MLGLKDPNTTFKQIYDVVKISRADQSDPSLFNARLLRKNLGKDTDLDVQDVMDLLLAISQNAYGRKPGQETYELTKESWM